MKRNTFFGILLVVFMFLGSCEREPMNSSESIENILANDIMEIKAGWEAFTFNAPLAGLPMNEMVVDWENSVQRDSVTGTAYEFPITQEFPMVLNSDRFEAESLALVVYDGAERLYRVVRMLHTENSAEASTFLEPSGLDGTVHVYDLEGKNILVMAYEKGELVASAVEEGLEDVPEVGLSKTARCNTRKSASWASLKRSYNSNCNGGGGYNRVRVEHYTDWFNHRGNGQWEFQRSEHTGTTYEYVYSSGAGYGGATIYREKVRPNGGSSVLFNSWWRQNSVFFNTTPEGYEKKYKIINNLTGKADCVYKKLQRENPNLFINTIRKFIDDPEYHLTLKEGNCNSTDDACTDASDVNNIVIKIEDTNLSSIEIASLILHEGIHAEIHRYVSRFESGIDPNERARLFQLYAFYKGRERTGNIQHIYMTERYIQPIASALRQIDENRYPLDYYKSFAWDGLRLWDANGLLSIEEDTRFNSYRNIVIKNSKIPCN